MSESATPVLLADGESLSAAMLRRLFIGQCLVLVMHLPFMPLWLLAVAALVAWRRHRQLIARAPRASVTLRLAAIALLCVALWAQYGGFGDLEALLGVLIGIYLLKLLETRSRRDARVVVGIGFVVLTASFLHDQSIFMALGAAVAATWLVHSLVMLSGGAQARSNRVAWRETAWLLGLSAPLMVALFIVMPRLGPLWSLPTLERASTGLSDSMAPGDIAELSRSDARAFRVSFAGSVPAPAERYWRVYTLSHFDGERWSRETPEALAATLERPLSDFAKTARRNPFAADTFTSAATDQSGGVTGSGSTSGGSSRYRAEFLLEPDSRPWRPSLGTPLASPERQRFLGDGTFEGVAALSSRGLMSLASSGEAPAFASPAGRAWHTLLPRGRNPRTLALAKRLWQDAEGDPEAYMAAVMARFGEAPYRYTLEPPRLAGEHRVDDFLFDSQAGYCSHYASATAVLARAVGIPARVVAGFQGGERHPDGHLTVRDYDAHAWVEVWHDGAWRRLDPTAVIAPERIEQGTAALSAGSQAFLADAGLSPLRFRDVAWLNRARLAWERLEYRWQLQVVGYESRDREALLSQLLQALETPWQAFKALKERVSLLASSGAGALRLGAEVLGVLMLAALVGVGLQAGARRWRRPSTLRELLLEDAAWLARHGYPPRPGESPAAHLRRLAAASSDDEPSPDEPSPDEPGLAGGRAADLQQRQRDLKAASQALAEAIERVYYAPLDERERRRWHEAFHARRRRWRRAFRRVNRCRGRGAGRLARWRQTWHLGR